MLRYLYYFLIIYLLYRFVFNFLIPVISTSFKVKKQFDQAKQQMQEHMNHEYARQNNASATQQQNTGVNTDKIGGEYIDFEEVK
ncbi:MAG: hypothetical protein ACO29O_02050 [Chitinophagaceae bacterium]